MNPLKYYVGLLFAFFTRLALQAKAERTCRKYGFKNVSLGDVKITGNVEVGEGTYINSGHVQSGSNSVVKIGRRCNIGWNVFISATTHPLEDPTNPEIPRTEDSIFIGDRVWIGINVVIREGVHIGDDAIIGANSVVTHDVLPKQKVGGNPARPLQ